MTRSIFAMLLLTLFSCVLPAEAPDLAAAAGKVTQIVAHRGASAERPENTLASAQQAIAVGATAVEVDIRTTKDGQLVLSHDASLERATNGQGLIGDHTLAELRQLDAGSKFDRRFAGERIATLAEVLEACRGKVNVLLDLKETGDVYTQRVIAAVKKHGEPKRIIVGVRSTTQAREFRQLLPEAKQIGLPATPQEIEEFAAAGVETIRLWPKWLTDVSLVERVRKTGKKLHLNGTTGTREELQTLLPYLPDSLSADDPRQLIATLAALRAGK